MYFVSCQSPPWLFPDFLKAGKEKLSHLSQVLNAVQVGATTGEDGLYH
jgi:hypothetical protein